MAKIAIFACLLVAVLAIANATTIKTVIEENPSRHQGRQMQQCREEIQEMMPFRQCMMYFTMGQSGRRGRYNDVENPQQKEYMWECCEEMENIMPECRCEAIEEVVKMAEQEAQSYQGQGIMEKMRMTAMYLPKMCKWTQSTQCMINDVSV